jgi:TorA maturation chaperone TorD
MDRSTARSLIYNRLSLCYAYPDEEVYESIAAGEWLRGMREALRLLDGKNFDEYLGAIEQAIAEAKEGGQPEMAREYTRLFMNVFPHGIAPPCAIPYLKKEKQGRETVSEVLRLCRETGFAVEEDLKQLPGHIARQFELMGNLVGLESKATGCEKIKLEEMQMNFLSRFILPWVPIFCEQATEQSRFVFYRYLGNLTEEFMNLEKNYLGVPENLNSQKGLNLKS